MPLNYRSGFNRLFVVAWVGWAAYCLVLYPMLMRREIASEYDLANLASSCAALSGSLSAAGPCLDRQLKARDAELTLYAPQRYYLHDWWGLALAVLVPPPVVYVLTAGLFLGTKRTLFWIWSGFKGAGK
jgi:hypothetical protein